MIEIRKEQIRASFLELISIKGALDTHTARDFDRSFQRFTQNGCIFFILEASQLEKISNDGISSMFRLVNHLNNVGGHFVFLNLPSEIAMLFSFLMLNKRIPSFHKMEDALAAFQRIKIERNTIKEKKDIPEVDAEPDYSCQKLGENIALRGEQKNIGININRNKSNDLLSCPNCTLELHVHQSGPYMCPGCGYKFEITL